MSEIRKSDGICTQIATVKLIFAAASEIGAAAATQSMPDGIDAAAWVQLNHRV
jgi:hypothetical protein